MANLWFKFYGGEYLGDPKMLSLSPAERSCLLTLFCYASQSENPGVVKYLTEQKLMLQSGLDFTREEWDMTIGVLKKFEDLEIVTVSNGEITVKNWEKRQETNLSNAERQARYRENHKDSNEKVTQESNKSNARVEENRVEKKRIEKNIAATPLELFNQFKNNPLWEKVINKYPDRDYDYQFQLMCDWWLTNKKKLPQQISALENWLKNTKPDPGLQSDRMTEARRAEDKKKMEELSKIPKVSMETLNKLMAGKSGIGKRV
jgi:hypothetical protein